MTTFELVWLSTDAQLSVLTDTYQRASLLTKVLGAFNFPREAAHIRGILTPWMRIPLVFMAQGRMDIGERFVRFTPRRHRLFGWRMLGVRSDLVFECATTDLSAVEAVDFPSPVGQLFNLPFTRIRTTHAPPLDNFLVCVGGRIAIPRIRKRSLELRRDLLNLAQKRLA